MAKLYFIFILLSFLLSCNQNKIIKNTSPKIGSTAKAIFSKNVSDSFYISVSLPADYDSTSKTKYPVIYILDANLYFDIFSTIVRKYSQVGLTTSPVIIGVGYKNLQAMDSLRNRDYTFPKAFPEYEMTASGNADKFLNFLTKELLPSCDKTYNIDTTKRILMGHSLGGYFTLYAFSQSLITEEHYFSSYIAASPSLDYNNGYLLKKIIQAQSKETNFTRGKVYVTYGSLEDDPSDPASMKVTDILNQLKNQKVKYADYKFSLFSDLDHMDTQIPTFIKGLQWIFNDSR